MTVDHSVKDRTVEHCDMIWSCYDVIVEHFDGTVYHNYVTIV